MNAITSSFGILIAILAFWGTVNDLSSVSEPDEVRMHAHPAHGLSGDTPGAVGGAFDNDVDITLKGLVVDQDGHPVAGVMVVARPHDEAAYLDASHIADQAVTDETGHFVLPALAPGTYSVMALGGGHPPGIAKLLVSEDICPDEDAVEIVLDRSDTLFSA